MGTRARLERWAAALGFALALALSFPFRAGEVRFDIGMLAGWIALVPFALLVRGLRPRAAFVWSSLGASVGYAAVLFWLYVVVTVYGRAPGVAGVAAVIGVAAAFGAHAGLAGAAVAWLSPTHRYASVAVLPAAWVASEHLRSFDLFGGFPWAYLGYAAHLDGPMLELASFGGVWGLSFAMGIFAALLAVGRWRAAAVFVCAAHLVGFGLRLWAPTQEDTAPALRAAVVQAAIPQDVKWDAELARTHFQAHVELSRFAAAATDVDLVLWPEASVPVYLETQPEYRAEVVALAADIDALLVLGGTGLHFTPGARMPQFFNSAFAVTPESGIVDRYDKSHLVPFGEYIPLRSLLGFAEAIATGLADIADITPGDGPRVLSSGNRLATGDAVAALICYEVIYPDLVRRAVRSGARVLLNLTNDAWYGRTSAPHQFLAIAALRSAENGLPMLRAANTGVSAIIDAGGIVLEQTPIFERKAFADSAPPARPGTTVYTRFGDWVVWLSWGILAAFGGLRVVGRHSGAG